MATIALKWADAGGNGNVIGPDCAGDIVQNVYTADVDVTPLKSVALPINTILDMGIIPAWSTVTDVTIVSDDMDSGATLALDVGLISGTPGDIVSVRTIGAEFFSASTIAQAGGVARMTLKTGFRVEPVGYDRSIGIKIQAAATGLATTGKIQLVVELKG